MKSVVKTNVFIDQTFRVVERVRALARQEIYRRPLEAWPPFRNHWSRQCILSINVEVDCQKQQPTA